MISVPGGMASLVKEFNVGEAGALGRSQVNTRSPILLAAVYFNKTTCLSKKGRIWPLGFKVNCGQLMGTCHLHEVQPEFSPLLL